MSNFDVIYYSLLVLFSMLVGVFGYNRNIGSLYAFCISIFLTPVIGFIITLWTNNYRVKPPSSSTFVRVVGLLLVFSGMLIASVSLYFLNQYSNSEIVNTDPSFIYIKLGAGLFFLGLFNIENGKGQSFASIASKEIQQSDFLDIKEETEAGTIQPVPNIQYRDNDKKADKSKIGWKGNKILALSITLAICSYFIIDHFDFFNSSVMVIENLDSWRNKQILTKDEKSLSYISQMLNGNTQTISVKGVPKANNGDWSFSIPNNWKVYYGDQPHVIFKMGDTSNPNVDIVISGNNLNYDFKDEDINDFFSSNELVQEIVRSRGISLFENKILINGMPGYMAETAYTHSQFDQELKIRTLTYFFIDNKSLFNLSCSVVTDDVEDNLSLKMKENIEFFRMVAGSVSFE